MLRFGVIFLLVYVGIGVYIGIHLVTLPRYFLPGAKHLMFSKQLVFWPLFFLWYASFLLGNLPILNRFAFVRQIGVYSLALILYLFLSLAVCDVVCLVLRFFQRDSLTDPLRAARIRSLGIGAALCLSLVITVAGAVYARVIRTVPYNLTIPKKGPAHNLRIVLISDLHLGATVNRAWAARIVDAVNAAGPDLVCVAGDIFDGNLGEVRDSEGVKAELRRIQARYGVYACLGNHDVDRASLFQGGDGIERIADFVQDAGFMLLQDEVRLAAEGLYIAGRRDARPIGFGPREPRKSIAELTASLDRENTLIMLDHQPVTFPEAWAAGVDLLCCGHTHRGQIFPANLITRRIFAKAGATHYGYWHGGTGEHAMQAIVTSGAGLWGPPLRIATSSEVAVIDLRFEPPLE